MPPYLAAAVQLHAGMDKPANLATATRLVEDAAAQGAQLIVLPEYFNCLGPLAEVVAQAETLTGPTATAMGQLAARLQITLVAGSFCEQSATPGMGHNTSLVFGPTGELLATYRKRHLFDIELAGQLSFQESKWILPGQEISLRKTTLGNIGQAICYDLRFPELFRQLADAGLQVLAFPSAFADKTGQAHWEVLLRARAIENQSYVIAANQFGQHTPNFTTYGHSLIIDPWGTILAQQATGEGVILAEIDLEREAQIRRDLPALAHRRRPPGN